MSDEGGQQPQNHKAAKPPRNKWRASESFFDLKLSHWIEILLTAALVYVGTSQLLVYRRQAKIMGTQAIISKGQLDEMQLEQRPWVHNKEMPVITKFLYLPNGNIHVEMRIDMENVGRTPAQNASGRIIIKTGTFAVGDNLRKEICTLAEWRDIYVTGGMRGITIFPNDKAPDGLFSDINKDDITVEKVGDSFDPYIVGCIAYTGLFNAMG